MSTDDVSTDDVTSDDVSTDGRRGYDHLVAGTPASAWQLGGLPPIALPYRGDHLLVLAAHPDDETLGAGGLIARCARRGVVVTVVVATDGEASHPGSATRTPARLAELRRAEVQAAVSCLAPDADVHFLGLPDGGLRSQQSALGAELGALAADVTHLVSPWIGDRHPDHEASGHAAVGVAEQYGARHWQYPIWAWHWADPSSDELPLADLRGVPLDAVDHERKLRALDCHTSQHTPLSDLPGDEAILPAAILEHFTRSVEVFLPPAGRSEPADFERRYRRDEDPWQVGERFFEQRKRELHVASLPRRRFRRAFEPGCGLGLLTERLADRCDEVVAWDVAEGALVHARDRLSDADHVSFERRAIPDDWPSGAFDLVVLSEVGYYCLDLDVLVSRVLSSLTDDGVVLGCHWARPAPDHPQTARAVHAALAAALPTIASHVEDDFLLHVWTRSGRSVATDDGIVA